MVLGKAQLMKPNQLILLITMENVKRSESYCTENDVILRPIHVYGIGDSKFPIWMNIERQIEKISQLILRPLIVFI